MDDLQEGEQPVSKWHAQMYAKRLAWREKSEKKVREASESIDSKNAVIRNRAKKDIDCWLPKYFKNVTVLGEIEALYPSQKELLVEMAEEAHSEWVAEQALDFDEYCRACDSIKEYAVSPMAFFGRARKDIEEYNERMREQLGEGEDVT